MPDVTPETPWPRQNRPEPNPLPERNMERSVKPCPFCGSEKVWPRNDSDTGEWMVQCGPCGACGPTSDSQEGSVVGWNTQNRPDPNPLSEKKTEPYRPHDTSLDFELIRSATQIIIAALSNPRTVEAKTVDLAREFLIRRFESDKVAYTLTVDESGNVSGPVKASGG